MSRATEEQIQRVELFLGSQPANRGDLRDALRALLAERTELLKDRERLLNVARGCFDYGGGYRADDDKLHIFHHGIQTVINALDGAAKEPESMQVRVLETIGRLAATPPKSEAAKP